MRKSAHRQPAWWAWTTRRVCLVSIWATRAFALCVGTRWTGGHGSSPTSLICPTNWAIRVRTLSKWGRIFSARSRRAIGSWSPQTDSSITSLTETLFKSFRTCPVRALVPWQSSSAHWLSPIVRNQTFGARFQLLPKRPARAPRAESSTTLLSLSPASWRMPTGLPRAFSAPCEVVLCNCLCLFLSAWSFGFKNERKTYPTFRSFGSLFFVLPCCLVLVRHAAS
mmetsp:Transcript_39299/g.96157  ORF Transcript_39299/g.96157 Transcript_39299/m.96157 type:complete len:224 (-) Transcript_39299:108-779(-)